MFDLTILSRIQFAFTVTFHIIWPTLTIGLGLFLLITEIQWLRTKNKIYLGIYKFWVKIFALAFGMGVVTGLPLAYEFGTNFANLSKFGGNILGPLLGVEVLTAFFIEASLIGIMIFGWGRVSPMIHLFATLFVVIGTHNSAFWILSTNSFLQTPEGFEILNGKLEPKEWSEVIFNPSFHYRFFHMLLASYVTTSMLVAGVSAYQLLRKYNIEVAKASFSTGLIVLSIVVPLQLFAGDAQGRNTLKYQPLKIAAIEGIWETTKGAPLSLFAIPDQKLEKNLYEIKIPHLASIILTHSYNGELKGLKDWPAEDRPRVLPIFYFFRIMVGIGVLLLGTAVYSIYLRVKKKLFDVPLFLKWCALIAPIGFLATISGWYVTELGRQPWMIYNILKVKDAVSPIQASAVAISLTGFVIIYIIMFSAFLIYFFKLIRTGAEINPSDKHNDYNEDKDWLSLAGHTSHVIDHNIKNKGN